MEPTSVNITRRQTLKALFAFMVAPKSILEAATEVVASDIHTSPAAIRMACEISRAFNWFSHPTAGYREIKSKSSKAFNAASMIERFSPEYFQGKLPSSAPLAKAALSDKISPNEADELNFLITSARKFKDAVSGIKQPASSSDKLGQMLNQWLDALSNGQVESVIDHPCRKAIIQYLHYLQGQTKLSAKEIKKLKDIFRNYEVDFSEQDQKFDSFYQTDAVNFFNNVCYIRFFLDNNKSCRVIPNNLIREISYCSNITEPFAEAQSSFSSVEDTADSKIVESVLRVLPNFREIIKEAECYITSNRETPDWQSCWCAELRVPHLNMQDFDEGLFQE